MPVGELLLSAVFKVLFEKMTSELWRFLKQEGLDSKITRWEKKLRLIEAVLADAEKKQITNAAVKMWLDDLRDLAYDVEDILDEFATEVLTRKLKIQEHTQQASSSKVRNFLSVCFENQSYRAIKFRRSMESAIEDVTSRLEELYKFREELGLKEIAGGVSSSAAAIYRRPRTTSLPTEPAVYGRDQDKDRVIQMVMKEEQDDVRFRVTAIVGMGGVGKTTLAREVYNDTRMNDFKLRAWVCISEDFDVLRISKAILRSMTSSYRDYKDLDEVQLKLREIVTGKKFLIVLDDVWSKDYRLWEILKSPFMSATQGSKIIVTTRLVDVALMMNPGEFYELKLLSDNDCWFLFMSHAFESRDASTFHDIELIKKKVIQNCKGLPLAAKTLGGLLRSKRSEDEWLEVLNSKLWELSDDVEIPTALKLSYYHLPSHLKRCFAYCAILPKDYKFDEEMLIHLWMAEGFLQKPNESRLFEEVGHEYFRDLESRSIFQVSGDEEDKYVLHDLVSDLAQWVSGETSFTLDVLGANSQRGKLEKVRHFSYVFVRGEGKKYDYLLNNAEQFVRLRTFLPFSNGSDYYFLPQTVVYDLLPKFSKLRALSMKGFNVTLLPESIGDLKHLRYFNLSYTKIKSLPKSTCSLVNLQIMKLKDCRSLRKLPSKLSNLINLRHLDIRGAASLSEMPSELRELKYLQVLTDFIVGKDSGSRIKDIKHFKYIRGELTIKRLENVMHPRETNEMILKDAEDIKMLNLMWSYRCRDTPICAAERHVLNMLQPHPNVEGLTIDGYRGGELPSWLGNSMLSNVVFLNLYNCEKCTYLPSLGRLHTLKGLYIGWMKGIKSIGHELYGEGCSEAFQSLETLWFQHLEEWELWEPTKENEHVQVFPRLRQLYISACPKLFGKLPDDLSSLENLRISYCTKLVVSLSTLPMLCELSIVECDEIGKLPDDLSSLEKMEIGNCTKLVVSFSSLPMLRELYIGECDEIGKLPDDLSSLEKLVIGNCTKRVVSFSSLPMLRKLHTDGCGKIGKLPDDLSSLEKLEIVNCTKLREFNIDGCDKIACINPAVCRSVESMSLSNISEHHKLVGQLFEEDICVEKSPPRKLQNFSLLKELHFTNCTNLISLPEVSFLSNLIKLEVIDCNALASLPGEMNHNNPHLEVLIFDHCSSLTFIVKGQPPSSMRFLEVSDCEKLECVFDDKENAGNRSTSFLLNSPSVSFSSSSDQCPVANLYLTIFRCSQLTCISSSGQLPEMLYKLRITDAPKFESIVERFHGNMNVESIHIEGCDNLKYIPEGLDKLNRLKDIKLWNCPNLVFVPEGGLPNTISLVSISRCEKLEDLPNGLPNLDSLRQLEKRGCSRITSFTETSFLTKLTTLILDRNNNLTSLTRLTIGGCLDAKSFPQMQLPPTVTELIIVNFPKLKYLSSAGFQNLTSLQLLRIISCPKLLSFPKQGLPSSLLELDIRFCPWLAKECKIPEGKEWRKISHIQRVLINCRSIYELENGD